MFISRMFRIQRVVDELIQLDNRMVAAGQFHSGGSLSCEPVYRHAAFRRATPNNGMQRTPISRDSIPRRQRDAADAERRHDERSRQERGSP
jgi:hypothetical protein